MSIQHSYDTSYEVPSLMFDIKIANPFSSVVIAKRGKVDTGADLTRVPETLTQRLTLIPSGETPIRYGNEAVEIKRTYLAVIMINGFSLDAEVYFGGRRDYILIGRNVLNQLIMHCHGKNQLFWFEDP